MIYKLFDAVLVSFAAVLTFFVLRGFFLGFWPI